ncbi:MAG: aldehyde:ferredoxin oxidoreductase, partial [Bacteroidia bacterium]|nr:aldehyde:ferredoxin oxidoreductase [Bacteroidia bacterium]
MNIKEMLGKHKLIAEFNYEVTPLNKGYTDKVLYLNISDNTFKIKDVPLAMKEKFIGGKGYGLKLLWDATKPDTKWNDPENEIVISSGPIAGITQYSGTGKSLVVTLSPASGSVTDSNAGGYFGPFVKFSGFDAIELQGRAKNDIIIIIDGTTGTVRIEEAPAEPLDSHLLSEILTEMYADSEESKHNVSVVSTGMAAEHSWLGMLNFSFWDKKKGRIRLKQAGRGGIGAVLRNKKVKALVCKISGVKGNLNNVVDLPAIMERGKRFNTEI